MTYIIPPLEIAASDVAQQAFDSLAANLPGWTPDPSELDTVMIETWADIAAEQASVVSGITTQVFRYFGTLAGVPPIPDIAATGNATFNLSDALGHTIPVGTVVGVRDADNALQGFYTSGDVVVAPGPTSVVVSVTCENPGAASNGLSSAACELINVPTFVTSVSLAPTSGGADAEDDDVYLSRLVETLALLAPRPIIPPDFAVIARTVGGVFRASAVDLLKPGPPYSGTAEAANQPLTITVAVADVNGASVGGTIRGQVDALLQSERETAMAVYVVDPQYQSIDVTAAIQAWPGFDTTTVHDAVVAAFQSFLSPARWGADQYGNPAAWVPDNTVRLGELYEAIASVSGVRYATSITFRATGVGALGVADVVMGGASLIPVLTQPGAINVTVTPG